MKNFDVQPDNGGYSILWYAPSGAWRDGRNFSTEAEAVAAAEKRLTPEGYCADCGGATEVDGVTLCLGCRDQRILESRYA